ncbi:c-type cytochrome, partial [bacterium]|nr:c-type cytochrome [bacterium]
EKLKDAELPDALRRANVANPDMRAGRSLVAGYECLKCHSLGDEGQYEYADLSEVGVRLRQDWVRKYLVAPYRFDGHKTVMPTYFYNWDDRQGSFSELLSEASADINLFTAYFFELSKNERNRLDKTFTEAKRDYPHIKAEMGEKIFRSQNCVACHKYDNSKSAQWKNAPDLRIEGSRVNSAWLHNYLRNLYPIRPFGYYPGTGSRMPDFGLSKREAKLLADFLLSGDMGPPTSDFRPQKLSAFANQKADKLLREKFACLGCHHLGNEGGRVGPSLSSLKDRLRPNYIYQILSNPQAVDPHIVMPSMQNPDKQVRLIANFLLQQNGEESSDYLSLVRHPIYFYEKEVGVRRTFLMHCASCHGVNGLGDGFNARYLPTQPRKHADAEYLSTRPDDTLFDGIFAGGAILNKSHLMPEWGGILTAEQIKELVRHIREQCQCEGPSWAEDDR